METEDTIIHIDWDGPHSLEAVEKLNGSTDLWAFTRYTVHILSMAAASCFILVVREGNLLSAS